MRKEWLAEIRRPKKSGKNGRRKIKRRRTRGKEVKEGKRGWKRMKIRGSN